MRVFYLFNINEEFKSITKDEPYSLFNSLNQIYRLDNRDVFIAFDLINQIIKPFDKRKLNLELFDIYRNNNNYTKFNNIHIINNYFNDEKTELTIKKSYLLLRSTVDVPSFLKDLNDSNVFVCDFKNKDYFWLDNLTLVK